MRRLNLLLAAALVLTPSLLTAQQLVGGRTTTGRTQAIKVDTDGTVFVSGGAGGGGDASAANQTSVQATAGNDATKAVSIQGITSGKAVPVSAASLPLPSGAATAANQTTANTSLATIATNSAAATPAGTNLIGKVGIDQTTDGTTNAVNLRCNFDTSTTITSNAVGYYGCKADTYGQQRVTIVVNSAAPVATATSVGLPMARNSNSLSNAVPMGVLAYGWNGTNLIPAPGDASGLVNQPFAITSSRWQYAAASGGISNTTTAVTIAAAAGAGLRNYITSVQIDYESLTTATELAIRDGAAGTVIWRAKLPSGSAGQKTVNFSVPLKGTANTLAEVVTLTASGGGAVYFNAQGYTGS